MNILVNFSQLPHFVELSIKAFTFGTSLSLHFLAEMCTYMANKIGMSFSCLSYVYLILRPSWRPQKGRGKLLPPLL